MNARDGGRSLADWHVNGASHGFRRESSLMTKMVPEGSLWSFGGLPEAVERNINSPPAGSKQMTKSSPQPTVLKQEYFTPRQQPLMRGQHGNPIIISSGGSYIQDEHSPIHVTLKRAGSPSVMHGMPTKRQQMVYTSSGMMHGQCPMPEGTNQFLLEEGQSFEAGSASEQHIYQHLVPLQGSQNIYKLVPQGRPIHIHPAQHNAQGGSPDLQQQLVTQFSQASYGHSPDSRFLHDQNFQHHSPHLEAQSQRASCFSPPKNQPLTLQLQSPQYRSAEPHQLATMTIGGEDSAYIRASTRDYQRNHSNMAENNAQGDGIQRAPARFQNQLQPQNEGNTRGYIVNKPVSRKSPARRARQLQLGSPIWSNTSTARKDVMEVRVRGRNVVPAGSMSTPKDQISHRQLSENPFTPPQQRARTPSVSSYRQAIAQRGRSRGVTPASLSREAPQPPLQQGNTLFQPFSVDEASEDNVSESTPLNELFRRQQLQGQASRNNFEESSYDVASALPQQSIWDRDRPKPAEKASPILQRTSEDTSQQSPEIVSIVSTPNGGEAASPPPKIRSVPMKERIAPAAKPSPKMSAATPKSVSRPKKAAPKTPKLTRKQIAKEDAEPQPDPEVVMQQRAAELIITKEIQGAKEAMDIDLFGEIIGLTEEEKAKKEHEMLAESQRKLLAKTEVLMAKEEAMVLADLERRRVAAEKEEEKRLEKEKEDEQTKAKRAAERKRQETLEEAERDELRRKAAEKIEADRRKAAEEAEERARKIREAKEKQDKVQAEAQELAKLKAKKEEAKKQAASLSAAKVSIPGEGERAGVEENDANFATEEQSLFVPQTEPEATNLDDRDKAKPVGPTSAAQVFAQSAPKAAISGYRAEREEAELRRERLAKESRLNARWKRQEAAQALQQAPHANAEPVKERPGPSKAPRQNQQPQRAKDCPSISPPPSDFDSSAGSAVSQPAGPSFISSASSSFGSNKSTLASLFPNDSRDPSNRVQLISDLERQRIDREELAKQAKGTSQLKSKRTELQKEIRRKRDDDKARERYKQQVIDEANKLGIQLSEADVKADVTKLMTKRENDRQRRREREVVKKNGQSIPAGDSLSQAFPASQHRAFSTVAESRTSTADEEEITLEEQLRRARAEAMRVKIVAAAKQKNPSFARAAAKKTVADFQSDTESEEDPDPEPAPAPKQIESSESAEELNSVESEPDDDATSAVNRLNPDKQDAQIVPTLPDMTASFEGRSRSHRPQSANSTSMGNFNSTPADSEHQKVMLYIVRMGLTFNGNNKDKDKDKDGTILGQWHSRKVANEFAAAKIQEIRKRPTQSIAERFNDDGLYNATVVYDREEKNQAYIHVKGEPMSSGDILDFDPSKVEYLLDEKTYFIYQFITQKKVNKETGAVEIHYNEPEILGHYSRLDMANHEACARLLELTKPKTAKIDYIEQHTNIWAPKLREARDKCNKDRVPFNVEMEKDHESLQWVAFDNVSVEVRLFLMKGPRN